MDKFEFRKFIGKCQEFLEEHEGRRSVCDALFHGFKSNAAVNTFTFFFRPNIEDAFSGWLCDGYNPNDGLTELERRLLFLESFACFCEYRDLYKDLYVTWDGKVLMMKDN